jgi:hypothetical protein
VQWYHTAYLFCFGNSLFQNYMTTTLSNYLKAKPLQDSNGLLSETRGNLGGICSLKSC